jgi:hypothetical protein
MTFEKRRRPSAKTGEKINREANTMKNFTITATFDYYERRNNSFNGNPCYFIKFTDKDGYAYMGRTATDASSAYIICDSIKGQTFNFTCHHTKTGAIIVDYIKATA